jgi:hypothetical protein
MATSYPASLDNFTNPTGSDTLASPDHAGQHTDINDAVEAIETELGTLPKGSSASVKARLDAVDVDVASRILALPYRSGAFYKASNSSAYNNNQAMTVTTTYYTPFYVTMTQTFDRIGLVTGTGFAGTGLVRLGIYNSVNGLPTTVLLDAGTVATSGVSTQYTITIAQSLSVGQYWLAFNTVTAGSTNNFVSLINSAANTPSNFGSVTISGANIIGYSESMDATSGFATAGVSFTTNTLSAVVGLRAN